MIARLPILHCVFAALVVTSFVACAETSSAGPAGGASEDVTFSKRKIRIGGKTITVEIADTPERRERGLMFRESLPENQGMLFIFPNEQRLSFWMMNTWIPLSIGYFDANRKLLEVQEMVPPVMGERDLKTYPSGRPAKYALEMPKGWFQRNKVVPGSTFTYADKQ